MAKFTSNNQLKYKTYPSVFYGFFGIMIPYLIIFLLLGEVNLLQLNWGVNNVITWQLYTIIFGITPLGFIWLLIGKLTRTLSLDSFPFLASSVMLSIAIFISSLIPLGSNDFANTLVIIGRVIIVVAFSIVTFFSVNAIVKIIIIKSPSFNSVVEKFTSNAQSDEISNERFKSVLDAWRKVEKKDDGFVEVSIEVE